MILERLVAYFFLTVPEKFYFPTWTVSERWAKMNERWTHAEWTMCEHRTEFGERYVNGERTQNASEAQTRALSEGWRQGERKMNDLFGKPRVFSSALSI